jgi:hypothetical protein
MRAHRFRVQIREDHEVRLKLPSDVSPGEAEVIVLESGSGESVARLARGTIDDLLASRLTPPAGVGPVTLADMEKAITEGAMGRGGV